MVVVFVDITAPLCASCNADRLAGRRMDVYMTDPTLLLQYRPSYRPIGQLQNKKSCPTLRKNLGKEERDRRGEGKR